ncbi:DUF2835 family protein [Nitrosomonas sp. JL21]|uniref:DUF2835 family protein n=1 Tax=Nitrosomonas sp. JL21 TaxID=153949 RepID=UPI00136BF765|nr:DUF2835 family protein [Nitrosomonas sp. JL21]MBL8498161.1 DUF2835 domain-containing protein [Nitrosomonas sp.]MXS77268.1 DUF2835 family protein [Nitrosomonas sp. JL21]
MHQHVRIVLNIPTYQLLHYYRGEIDTVAATTTDGRVIHFPANILRSVVHSDGVYGTFELIFDENHQFVSINRIVD